MTFPDLPDFPDSPDRAPAESTREPIALRWVIPFGICVAAVIAFSVAAQTYVQMLTPRAFVRAPVLLAVQPMAVLGCRRAGRSAPGRHARAGATFRSRVAVAVPIAVALIAAHLILASLLTFWLQPYVPVETYTLAVSFGLAMQNQLIVDVLVDTMLLILGYAAAVYDRARVAELRESRLEADLARAQLNALRLEIEPHFLFNTLNAIARRRPA